MKDWPESPAEPADFKSLVKPLAETLRYIVENGGAEMDEKQVIPYEGLGRPTSIPGLLATDSRDPEERLSPENREYEEERDRDIFEVFCTLVLHLGMEQGIRCIREDQQSSCENMRSSLKMTALMLKEESIPRLQLKPHLLSLLMDIGRIESGRFCDSTYKAWEKAMDESIEARKKALKSNG